MQQRIRIDIRPLPVALRIINYRNRKVEMVIAWPSISGVTNVSNNISLLNVSSLCKAIGVTLEMRIIEDQLFIGA